MLLLISLLYLLSTTNEREFKPIKTKENARPDVLGNAGVRIQNNGEKARLPSASLSHTCLAPLARGALVKLPFFTFFRL